ncbi:reverse transcriptase domain-containing protein [Desulfotignum balticum]|uniref:reverse transcriptase domain-containing protein n=1 Tax=Desulfotignum balticum TaxID=115781 RepID=UPI000418CBE6|nr:reverse transcriptase domain-containing protein [Desulfotignum balticum]
MSFVRTVNPNGGVVYRRVMKEPFSNDQLLERILSTENIRQAWKQVRSNKGASGIDGVTVDQFPDAFREVWPQIRSDLFEGTYVPSPVLRVEIPKPEDSKRPLGIPIVLDRIIQQAIAQVLGLIFDPMFSESSCGFRPGRSAHNGVRQVKHFIGQGGPLSPLLANILLDDLDKELERRGHHFVRYADDFIILVKNINAGNQVMASIQRFLEQKLWLKVNEKKSKVAPVKDCGFLGFVFVNGKIRWSDKSFLEFKRRLRLFTGRSWFVSMEYRYIKLAEYIRGWMNYYGISEYYKPVPGIDEWFRRRIRMCYWKQWRYTRTKVRNLLKLGTFKRQAIYTALSRRGPWHLSRTMAAQAGMTNKWLSEQGLISVKDQWVKIHYPATAR